MELEALSKDRLIEKLLQQQKELADLQNQYTELLTKYQSLCEELTIAYEEFNLVFEASGTGMCVIGKDFTIIKINRPLAEIINRTEDEITGAKCYDTFKGKLCHTDKCPVTRISNGEKSVLCEDEKESSSGSKFSCNIKAIPVRDYQGELIAVIEMFKSNKRT